MSCLSITRSEPARSPVGTVSSATVELVLASFNTWAFKREQPTEPALLRQFVSSFIQERSPVAFTMYWGKGPRSNFGQPERDCFAYLTSMAERIRAKHHAGAHFDIIYTDTHARLNGHSEESIARYFEAISGQVSHFSSSFHRLSTLVVRVKDWRPDIRPNEEMLTRLERCAEKWYGGTSSPREAAALYYDMNLVERQAVEIAFPGSIFITFNGSEFRDLFPSKLPVFYMYSIRRGVAVKPWFLADVAAPRCESEAGVKDTAPAAISVPAFGA